MITPKDLRQHKRWITSNPRTVFLVRYAAKATHDSRWSNQEAVVVANDVPHAMSLVQKAMHEDTMFLFNDVTTIVGVDIQGERSVQPRGPVAQR